ncbi:DUF2920 family protein [Campylobacter upsaliensis]|uniref:DUF2920 family protein n=1 Tax=Campylobacter upsaliensis TaxID=28080 RepID=UPI0035303E8D
MHPDFKTSEFAFNIHQILSNFIKISKENGVIAKDFKLAMSATLLPARNEYQNFGIMPALDILNALFYVQKHPPFSIEGGGRCYKFARYHCWRKLWRLFGFSVCKNRSLGGRWSD